MKKKKKYFNCPAEMTLSLIGGKWKAILLYNLRRGSLRFGELRRYSPGITQATLTTQLKELEISGLVARRVVRPIPKLAVEYSLTEKGETLRPVINSLIRWGLANQAEYTLGEFGMLAFAKEKS